MLNGGEGTEISKVGGWGYWADAIGLQPPPLPLRAPAPVEVIVRTLHIGIENL